jgi:hypothetical protein
MAKAEAFIPTIVPCSSTIHQAPPPKRGKRAISLLLVTSLPHMGHRECRTPRANLVPKGSYRFRVVQKHALCDASLRLVVNHPPIRLSSALTRIALVRLECSPNCRFRPIADFERGIACCDAASPKQTLAALQNLGKGPLCLSSIFKQGALLLLHVSPSNKTACFLPLCHFDDLKISNLGFS